MSLSPLPKTSGDSGLILLLPNNSEKHDGIPYIQTPRAPSNSSLHVVNLQ